MQHGLILFCFAATALLVSGNPHDLHVNVFSVQKRFGASQGVKLLLKYSNDGTNDMGVYEWLLPKNGLADPLFEVTLNGEPVDYVGPLMKRRVPLPEDIVTLPGGSSLSAVFDLSAVYNMTQTGNYVIKYKMNAQNVVAFDGSVQRRTLFPSNDDDFLVESGPLAVFAVGRPNQIIEDGLKANAQGRALTATYYSCSASQSSSTKTAISEAENYANDAVRYFNAGSVGSRYTTWFGTYSSTSWNKAKSNFIAVRDALSTKSISIDCSCPQGSSGTYAYVYANQHYKVYLCGQFWNAPMLGTDSKAATIIHELAHFTILAGTNDYAYGHTSAKSLARSSPSQAIANSDNMQYFAENNPTLY